MTDNFAGGKVVLIETGTRHMTNKRTFTVDFDAVSCNPRHMTETGKGWRKRLLALGASKEETELLVDRLRDGMAARIELNRIKALAGVAVGDPSHASEQRTVA